MSEHSDGDKSEQNPAANIGESKSKAAAHDLPFTDSPPLSPGEPSSQAEAEPKRGSELIAWTAPRARPHFRLRPRHRRRAALAASIILAAVFGAAAGGFAMRYMIGGERQSALIREENKAMTQSIAHLARQIAGLKTSLAEAKKATHTQIAELAERVESAPERRPEVTGSIPTPAKPIQSKPSPAETTAETIPLPRPAPRTVAAAVPPAIEPAESHPTVVPSWRVRGMRRGYVYVEGHGDVFRVAPGAVLPDLGRVEAVGRQHGHWVVVTPKGLIVSRRLSGRFPGHGLWDDPDF